MSTETFTPIVIDLGKKSASKIKKLKKGEGELMDEIQFTYNNVKSQIVKEGDNKEIVPLVILYEEKDKNKTTFPFPFPFPFVKV